MIVNKDLNIESVEKITNFKFSLNRNNVNLFTYEMYTNILLVSVYSEYDLFKFNNLMNYLYNDSKRYNIKDHFPTLKKDLIELFNRYNLELESLYITYE